jgi:ribonuclease HI
MGIKILKFRSVAVEDITSGRVNKTWRLFDDKQLSIDDLLQLINSDTEQPFGYAKIIKITAKHLADIDDSDMEGHKKYQNTAEVVEYLTQFYGPRVNPENILKVIEFKYLGQKLSVDDEINTTLLTEVDIYTDGGSRGNPGPSACSYVILDCNKDIVKNEGIYLGITTNNQAEYQAVLHAIKAAIKIGAKDIHIFADSLLVVNQMNGIYKIKNQDLIPIYNEAKHLIEQFNVATFTHIPREMNRVADEQVNNILDKHAKEAIGATS